jgi:DNA-binding MurR/RpiR family transcriptional regulator
MNIPPFLTRIEQALPALSKGHRKIAEYILREYDKAAFLTAAALGEAVGISESTVVRFAAEIGFKGYPDLQKYLQEMIRSRLTTIQRMQASDVRVSNETVLDKVMSADAEMIRLTLEQTSREDFRSAVFALNTARKIYVQGARSSAALATFLSFYLNILYDDVIFIDAFSSSQMFEQMLRIGPEDVCVAISFPRYSSRTVTALRFAQDRGACAIAITDSRHSPIAALARFILVARSDTISFVDSLVAPLSLINALLAACARSQGDKAYETLRSLEQVWADYNVYDSPEEELMTDTPAEEDI